MFGCRTLRRDAGRFLPVVYAVSLSPHGNSGQQVRGDCSVSESGHKNRSPTSYKTLKTWPSASRPGTGRDQGLQARPFDRFSAVGLLSHLVGPPADLRPGAAARSGRQPQELPEILRLLLEISRSMWGREPPHALQDAGRPRIHPPPRPITNAGLDSLASRWRAEAGRLGSQGARPTSAISRSPSC